MGKSTSILGNHSLNTSNLKVLAKDLAKRLHTNIKYGYRTEFDYECLKKGVEPTFEIVYLGETSYISDAPTFVLIDNNYQYHQFIKKYGLDELKKSVFDKEDYLKKQIIESEHIISYYLEKSNDCFIDIFRNNIMLWMVDDIDWRSFQDFFIYQTDQDFVDYLNELRLENRDWIYKLGGNYMFIGCCEDESWFIFEETEYNNEKELFDLIKTKLKNEVVNLPNYIMSKAYLSKPNPDWFYGYSTPGMFEALKKGISLTVVEEDYPMLFYDDFFDLPESNPIKVRLFDTPFDDTQLRKQILLNTERKRKFI